MDMTKDRKQKEMDYSVLFRLVRERMNLNMDQMGELLNLSKATISLYESGARMPSIKTFLWYLEKSGDIIFTKELCRYCNGNGHIVVPKFKEIIQIEKQ